jgi:hypothetical protein
LTVVVTISSAFEFPRRGWSRVDQICRLLCTIRQYWAVAETAGVVL